MKSKRIGISLVIVGLAGAAILGLLGGISESRAIGSFGRANVGCRTWFQFDKPGTYYVFVETGRLRVVDQGCPPSATSDELVLSLYADSRPIALVPDASLGYDYDQSSAVSTSRFVLETSGRFELVAVGPNVEQVIALGADPGAARRPWWFAAGMVLTIGVLGGLVLLMNQRFGHPAAGDTKDASSAPRIRRPRLPASVLGATKPKVEPRPSQDESAKIITTTQEVAVISEQPAVADTPAGTTRPISAPVVSSGSTAGASRRSSGRRAHVGTGDPRDWDIDDPAGETVGDALGIDDPGRLDSTIRTSSRSGRRRRAKPAPGRTRPEFVGDALEDDDEQYGDDELDYDEFDSDELDYDGADYLEGGYDGRFDDGWSDDEWVDGAASRPEHDHRRRDDTAGRRPRSTRSRTRNGADGDYSVDYPYGPGRASAERVEDYLDDDRYDDEYDDGARTSGRGRRGYVEDYLDDVPFDRPPRERPGRRTRGVRGRSAEGSGRGQYREGSRPVRGSRSRNVDRGVARRNEARGDWDEAVLDDRDDDGYSSRRSLAEQGRTQPRRRRTPPPPPPPNDDWEELPPPTRSQTGEDATTVVSDEWSSDGDDTGSWRWWLPPDPSDRAKP